MLSLRRHSLLACLLLIAGALPSIAAQPDMKLWYGQPAGKWEEALPLGNGRLGAMVYGGADEERLQLNEESLWAGEPTDVYPDHFAENLHKVQQLVLDGKIGEARELGLKTLTMSPTSFRSYQPLGDLRIVPEHAGKVDDYRRELDLERGVVRVSYRAGGVRFTREIFISAVDDVLAMRLSADTPGRLKAQIRMIRSKDAVVKAAGQDRLLLDGQIVDIEAPKSYDDNPGGSGPGGKHMKFAARLLVRTRGGTVSGDDQSLVIDGADEAVILLTAATDYNLDKMNFDRSIDPAERSDQILKKAAGKAWPDLLKDHVAEHGALMNRVSLDLGPSKDAAKPTDARLAAGKDSPDDPGLAALYFQYGRYLLMSSSRHPGRLPANLQGIWNDKMWAPWESDYHLNINLQMNYWPADVCNLGETVDPLVQWMTRLARKGSVTAQRLYGIGGWLTFLATNPFGRTTPSASSKESQFQNGVLDPLAGAWMSMALWRHYEFTRDRAFLEQQAYPVLKGAAQFILDFLVEDHDGLLVIVPSTSPENTYADPKTGKAVRITRGSTYHMSIARAVFQAVIEASRVLEKDAALRERLEAAMVKFPPVKIGSNGTIQEWIEDYVEKEPQHRHLSHLVGLHPFSLITAKDADLLEAVRKTLERRGFGGDVGWSNAWKVSIYARLHDAEKAHSYFHRLIHRNAFPNLMDALWPGRTFQIDGNLAGSAGVAEMLLQSHTGRLELLPALPKAWANGRVSGLGARGAFEVDMQWADGSLSRAAIKSRKGGSCTVCYKEKTVELKTQPGQTVRLDGQLKAVE